MVKAKLSEYVIYVIALCIPLTLADPFNSLDINDYLEEPNTYEHYYLNEDGFRNNDKRDIIKGPSLFSKIDASTADSDLAFENDEVSHLSGADVSKYYTKPAYDSDSNLDDIGTWSPSSSGRIGSRTHKKNVVNERASKKSTFPSRHLKDDDVPDEVIKALYNWKIDDSPIKSAKSKVANSSIDSDSDTSKPVLTEDSLSADEHALDEPAPSRQLRLPSIAKKRRKINVLVNLKINEAPRRRSGVRGSDDNDQHGLSSSLITLSTETEMPQKRHFPYFLHQRRRHKVHHPSLRKIIGGRRSDDASSGESSGSGASDVNPREQQESEEIKPVATGYSAEQKPKANIAGESDENEGSGSGQAVTNVQVSKTPRVVQAVNATNTSASDTSKAEDLKDESTKEGEATSSTASSSGALSANIKTEHEGSGEQQEEKTLTNTQESEESKVDTSAASQPNSNDEKSNTVASTSASNENEDTHKSPETQSNEKSGSSLTSLPVPSSANEDKDAADKVSSAASTSLTQSTETEEGHKADSTSTDEAQQKSVTKSVTKSEGEKDKQSDTSNNDGTDNMKKKSGQEDKYETLEEVREKFKKWESNIVQSPSENTFVDEKSSLSPKIAENDESEHSTIESHLTSPKADEDSEKLNKKHDSAKPAKETKEPEDDDAKLTKAKDDIKAALKTTDTEESDKKSDENKELTKSDEDKELTKSDENKELTKSDETKELTKSDENKELTKSSEESSSTAKAHENKPVKSNESDLVDTKLEEAKDSSPASEDSGSSKEAESEKSTNDKESASSTEPVNKTNSSENSEELSKSKQISNTTTSKSSETNATSISKAAEAEAQAILKTTDLSTSEIDKDTSEDELKPLMKEKQPDDFVKELIGIPAKKLTVSEKNEKNEKEEAKPKAKISSESKGEKESEEGKSLPKPEKGKAAEDSEEHFNMDEVKKKNNEHHDIADSDMKHENKDEEPEKATSKAEGTHKLNSSDVTGFADQVPTDVTSETSSPSLSSPHMDTQEITQEEKTFAQPSSSEEKSVKSEEKSHAKAPEKNKVKQSSAETKSVKLSPEVDLEPKEPKEKKKQSEDKVQVSKKTSTDKKKKKIAAKTDAEIAESFLSSHDKAALANPLITKEANEFSNEQEKSFASAIEKIKAQEEKLKGKEIDNEIKETLKPSKKHQTSKKSSESNLKQLKIYRHQILSEVGKIDDLISEYHKDGHSTKELSEAKIVLQNDLNLVKELEKNTKKKTIKKDKTEKDTGRLQPMPSSAYLNEPSKDEKDKDEMNHHRKSGLDSKTTAKSFEREQDKTEKELEEYYFSTSPKSTKRAKKPSLEEIHKLLRAEIKSLKQKKNGKADSQLKNIRKLVQQHLKKLISSGDIDKMAFRSLAPEIRQLGELLKERIKTLKKKKTARKSKTLKDSALIKPLKSGNKKAASLYDQSMEAQISTNELKGTKVKTEKKPHRLAIEPKIGILEPSLDNVKGEGETSSAKPETPSAEKTSSEKEHTSTSSASSAPASTPSHSTSVDTKEHKASPSNQSATVSAPSSKEHPTQESATTGAADMNIRNLLTTLNEKLGVVYQSSKSPNLVMQQVPLTQPAPEKPGKETTETFAKDHHHNPVYDNPLPGLSAGSTQRYVGQKPITGSHTTSQEISTPTDPFAAVVAAAQVPAVAADPVAVAPPPASFSPPAAPEQVPVLNPPSVIDVSEPPAAVPSNTAQVAMAAPVAPPAMPPAQAEAAPAQEAAPQTSNTPTPQAETNQAAAESKESLPMVPDEPEFEEDTTEALASLEPINTLVETLEKDITEIWSYKDLYPNAEALGLDNEKVHNTYANLGSLSGLSLRRALNRALRGEDVGLGVVGGSISKGGPFSEKGLEYVLRSYFYAIEDYWNKVIRPVTGSSMIVRDVSLGGISTDYYSFCIRNHLPDDKLTNIVLWELSANDMRRYDDSLKPKPQPLEQFTRNILTYRAKPSLVFVNFFALFDWDPDLRANCRNFEDEGEDEVAKYYKITSLSWRNMVCPLLKSETSPIFTRQNLFAEDHFHPSILGHAQMSYIIIDYIRTEFLKNLVKMRPFFIGDAVEKLQIPRSIYMPRPMFKETFLWKPLCYTYMLVDNRLPNNTMPLHEENESDFKYTVVRGFKIRSDKIAGMETKLKDQFIRYKLQVPRHEDGGVQPFKQLGIMSFTDDRYAEVQFDSEHPVRIEAKKRFLEGTIIKNIAENIEPGDHALTVRSGDIGFLICALVLG